MTHEPSECGNPCSNHGGHCTKPEGHPGRCWHETESLAPHSFEEMSEPSERWTVKDQHEFEMLLQLKLGEIGEKRWERLKELQWKWIRVMQKKLILDASK